MIKVLHKHTHSYIVIGNPGVIECHEQIVFIIIANHQQAAVFRHRNASVLQGCVEQSTEITPYPYLKTNALSRERMTTTDELLGFIDLWAGVREWSPKISTVG